jgi:S1-C subfamily serine protease
MKKALRNFLLVILILIIAGAVGIDLSRRGKIKWPPFFSQAPSAGPVKERLTQKIISEESVVIEVVEKASPSVVSVGLERERQVLDPFGSPFDPFGFFGDQPFRRRTQHEEASIATGFVIDKSGLIVTNKHVVTDLKAKYNVVTADGKKLEVEKVYRDPENDLAILKVSGDNLQPLPLGDSDNLKLGQFVIAIGNALGEFPNSVTTGVVSGLGRAVVAGDPFGGYQQRLDNLIQTDAAINPGNSGGPLLNSAGQVIGINAATTQGAQNIGFAIPINVIKESIKEFNDTGKFSRAFLGVRYRQIGRRLALLNDVPEGAFVVEVVPNSPADKAGIKADDIITSLAGDKVSEENPLADLIKKHKPGEKVDVKVFRGEKEISLQAKLQESP